MTATVAQPGARSLLARDDFRRYWIGGTVSELGSRVTSVALPIVAVVTLHASAFAVSALAAVAWLPWLVIGLPVGAWIDRLPRRRVMICADAVSLVAFASVPIAAWGGVLTIAQLLGVALLGGVAVVFFQTADNVYFPSLVEPVQLGAASSLVRGAQSATGVGGPGVAGGLTALFGAASGLLVDAVSFLISAICLLGIEASEPAPPPPQQRRRLREEIAEGIRFVARDPYLRVSAAYGAVANFGLIGIQSLTILFLVRDAHVGGALAGTLLATTSVGGVVGAALAGRVGRRLGTGRGWFVSSAVGFPVALLIPLTGAGPRLALFVGASFIVVAAVVLGNVLQSGWTPNYCPRELYGRITTSQQILNYGSIPLGALTAGVLATATDVRTTLWVMAALIAVAPLLLLLGPLRSRRDLPDAPAAGPASPAAGPALAAAPPGSSP